VNVGDVLRRTETVYAYVIGGAETSNVTWFNVTQNSAVLGAPNENEYVEFEGLNLIDATAANQLAANNPVKSQLDYIAVVTGLDFVKGDILRRYEFTLVNQITGVQTSVIEWRNVTQGGSLLSALPSEDEYVAYVKAVGTSNLSNQKLILGGWDTDLSQSFIETHTYDALGAYTSVFETFDGATWTVYTPATGALVYSDISVYQSNSTLMDILTRLIEIKAIQTDGTQKTGVWQGANQLAVNTDGSINIVTIGKAVVSSLAVTSGSVTGTLYSVTFTPSSDFVGTINGVSRGANLSYSFESITGAMPYTITAGSLTIDKQ
jgi:hypothetical protein